jgi:hypothetical protein
MTATFRLRGYTVERLLGRGGSGEVWAARATSSGARVALKRIPTASEEQRARARAEAALLSALDHPNLVRMHSMLPAGDALVLVLDLADGGSLAELLAARGRLTPGEVITAVAPVAAALAYLHGEGVVHGDVSAANILFTAAGVPLLGDVGAARLTGDELVATTTAAYVEPAVAAGGLPGPASDVFSLAAVALHALTGAPPWTGSDDPAVLASAAAGALGDVGERLIGAGVPAAMTAVLARALELDPQRRGTAADLALDLRHSAAPTAVELAAGRRAAPGAAAPWTGPRHAARPVATEPAARPGFERPHPVEPTPGVPPTRMVGPRPRPVIPRPPRRRRPGPRAMGIGLGVVVAAAVGGVLWLRAPGESPKPDAPRPAQPRAQVETLSASPASPVGASPPGPAAGPTPAQHAARDLAALDGLRARAFATRNAALLARVYQPGALLGADRALLRRLVPAGCVLRGVRTEFGGVQARAAPRGTVVTVTARLPASRLVCPGRPPATVPGTGPTRLRLRLVPTAAGVRIAEQALVGDPGGAFR